MKSIGIYAKIVLAAIIVDGIIVFALSQLELFAKLSITTASVFVLIFIALFYLLRTSVKRYLLQKCKKIKGKYPNASDIIFKNVEYSSLPSIARVCRIKEYTIKQLETECIQKKREREIEDRKRLVTDLKRRFPNGTSAYLIKYIDESKSRFNQVKIPYNGMFHDKRRYTQPQTETIENELITSEVYIRELEQAFKDSQTKRELIENDTVEKVKAVDRLSSNINYWNTLPGGI